jgi:transcriptional regulator with XRE-family HTH domain
MMHDETTPHPLDIALGSRIRLRRRELGLSQEQLALQIGITFQQVQKYEHGANRVSFSRLVEIAHALQCSAHDLIGDLDKPASEGSMLDTHIARLNKPGAVELLEAFCSIPTPKQRLAVLSLAKQLSDNSTDQASTK